MKSKYLLYQDEILELFDDGKNYHEISRHLIDTYCLDVSVDYLRKTIKGIVHYLIADKEIVSENVKLSKTRQRILDQNRIQNKAFREYARIENGLIEYNKELIKLLKRESSELKIKKHKSTTKSAILVQLADTHFNELVDIESNKYDFKIASKRLQKYAYYIKKYCKLHKTKDIIVGITGDLINSDRRMDEYLNQSTNRAKATFLSTLLLKTFLLELNKIANITVACVTGNESRVKQELGWTDIVASDNYDFTIFEMLRILLPQINFLTGNALEIVIEIGSQKVLLTHGHQLGKMDVNPVSKVIAKYSAKGINLNLIICGHLHETMIRDNVARSASLVGSNSYSERALNLSGTAAQNIYIFTDDGRQDIRIDLQDTSKYGGYEINKELEAYNAKSLKKTIQNKTIFKIVV